MKNKIYIMLILLSASLFSLYGMSNGLGCSKEIEVSSFIIKVLSGNLDHDLQYLNAYLGSKRFKKLQKFSSYDLKSILDLSKRDDKENQFICKEIVEGLRERFKKSEDYLFYTALANAHLNVIKLFINSGYDINKIYFIDTPLSYVSKGIGPKECEEGMLEDEILVNRNKVKLHYQVNPIEVVKLLIYSGADYNKSVVRGLKPIDIANLTNLHLFNFFVRLMDCSLFIHDIDNQKTSVQRIDNLTFLIQENGLKYKISKDFMPDFIGSMAIGGNLDVIELLVEYGIDLNEVNSYQDSPLMMAVNAESFNGVRLLRDMNVNTGIPNKYCLIPLSMALINFCKTKDAGQRLVYKDIIGLLHRSINQKIDFIDNKGTSWKGYTQLMVAIFFNEPNLVKLLIDMKADPNIQNNKGQTALMISIDNPIKLYNSIAQLASVSDLNIKDQNGETVIDIAIKIDDPKILEILIKEMQARQI